MIGIKDIHVSHIIALFFLLNTPSFIIGLPLLRRSAPGTEEPVTRNNIIRSLKNSTRDLTKGQMEFYILFNNSNPSDTMPREFCPRVGVPNFDSLGNHPDREQLSRQDLLQSHLEILRNFNDVIIRETSSFQVWSTEIDDLIGLVSNVADNIETLMTEDNLNGTSQVTEPNINLNIPDYIVCNEVSFILQQLNAYMGALNFDIGSLT